MPEYLAPGVYIEEIEIGAKPIEGVSTTTTGFIGMAERGPLNKPTLVTSFAEYQRIFGGYLSEKNYGNKRWLPYAVEGFFVNGGQRLYISRVATDEARHSSGFLPDIARDNGAGVGAVSARDTTAMEDVLLSRDEPQSKRMHFVKSAKAITLNVPLKEACTTDTEIIKMEKDAASYKIQKNVRTGGVRITLDDLGNLAPEDVLFINDETNPETCIIESVDADNKIITVRPPLKSGHSEEVELNGLTPLTTTKNPILGVKAGYTIIPVADTDTDLGPNDVVRISDAYFIIKATDEDHAIYVEETPGPEPREGAEVKQSLAIKVTAADKGTWGNKIKIVTSESSISSAVLTSPAHDQDYLDLDTVTGMEKGTVLLLHTSSPTYGTVTEVIKTEDTTRVKLQNVIAGSFELGLEVSTVEFDLMVNFDGTDESFRDLSMDEDHSRYIEKVITEGTSRLIRVEDVRATGRQGLPKISVPAEGEVWKLAGGNDGIPTDDELNTTYEGKDSPEPADRKGLYTLKNVDDINIVAIPGITTQHLQNKLIIHCETTMKDRFAVLDSEEKADLDRVQKQRNLYDSKYAALYYPWVRVFDPLSKKRTNVPPSGYMCGIYARSDIERGVHKAPANEIVRGALGLEEFDGVKRVITKGQQDILNPKGVNCIRAFRGRGIRVWGARTISSDSLWKYINVRRLFIFLEESIEEGTQWVVFEPNDEKLWARVRQTITQFLTRVWRDGALMGTTPGEAFFVRCDRTTMTQDDIDNGRLIVLIGVAPVKPAEFVIFRIAQWAGGSAATE